MHDGSVLFVSRNRVETLAHVKGLGSPGFMQFLVDAQFRLLARRDRAFQPLEEFDKRHSVALHGSPQTGNFLLVADGLQQRHRRFAPDNRAFRTDGRVNGEIRLSGVDKNPPSGKALQESLHLVIIMQAYLLLFQIRSNLLRHLFRRDEINRLFLCDKQIADYDRIAIYVVSSEIECPCYLVQSRQE